jgi:hypothetical protein
MLTALTTVPLQQVRGDDFGDLDADVFLGLFGGGAKVRGEDRVGGLEQRVVGGRWLDLEDVERGTGDPCLQRQRLGQGVVVNQAAAGAVDDAQLFSAWRCARR